MEPAKDMTNPDERARALVDKFKMETKDSEYTVIEGYDADQLILDIAAALREERRRVWEGLKLTNEQLAWALRELGPTRTQAEAYIKATVQYVMAVRQQAREEAQ